MRSVQSWQSSPVNLRKINFRGRHKLRNAYHSETYTVKRSQSRSRHIPDKTFTVERTVNSCGCIHLSCQMKVQPGALIQRTISQTDFGTGQSDETEAKGHGLLRRSQRSTKGVHVAVGRVAQWIAGQKSTCRKVLGYLLSFRIVAPDRTAPLSTLATNNRRDLRSLQTGSLVHMLLVCCML